MCLFCQIINGDIPSEKIYEDDKCIVIKDKYPSAPVHWLIIPKKHLASITDITEEDINLMGYLVFISKKIAQDHNLAGYKLNFNVNKEGGQVIFHIHLHFLAETKTHLPL